MTTRSRRYSHIDAVRTVTAREIQVALHSRGLIVTTVIIFALVVGGALALSWMNDRDDAPPSLVVSGVDVSTVSAIAGDSVEVSAVPDRDAALTAVRDNGKDAALVRTLEGFELVSDGSANATVTAVAQAAATTTSQNDALTTVGVDPAEFAGALPDSALQSVDVSDQTADDYLPAVMTTMIGTMVVLLFIMTFAATVGGRVTEEKSSRVVEIILATIRPLDLLIGKVLAMLVIGFTASAVILGAGLVSLAATGMLSEINLDPATLVILLVSFTLGMLFYSALYAAAGSMVSKAEDLGSTQMPVMLLFFAAMYPPIFGWSALDSTLMHVLTWIPPMSLGVAPMEYAGGELSLPGLIGSQLIFAATTFLVLLVVSRIYRGSILNNGRKLSWVRALRQA